MRGPLYEGVADRSDVWSGTAVTVIELSRHISVSEPFDLSVQLSYEFGEAQAKGRTAEA